MAMPSSGSGSGNGSSGSSSSSSSSSSNRCLKKFGTDFEIIVWADNF